jgi:NADPH:quinone reductase-like Zn-dependent oxidoreductase
VIGTASARHNAVLKSIGVDEIVDYTQGPFEDKVQDVDAVMDTVGGDTASRSLKTLKKGGTFSTVAGRVGPALCAAAAVTCIAGGGPPGPGNAPPSNEASEGELLRQVGALAAAGKFVVHVDKDFPLERAADAQDFNREGHTQAR